MINMARRGFLGGALALLAAPAIVRYESIMPVKSMAVDPACITTEEAYAEYVVNVLGTSAPWYTVSPERIDEVANILKTTVPIIERYPEETLITEYGIVKVNGWYDDPPDPYVDPEKLKLFRQRATIIYDKRIVENNMKPEWLA